MHIIGVRNLWEEMEGGQVLVLPNGPRTRPTGSSLIALCNGLARPEPGWTGTSGRPVVAYEKLCDAVRLLYCSNEKFKWISRLILEGDFGWTDVPYTRPGKRGIVSGRAYLAPPGPLGSDKLDDYTATIIRVELLVPLSETVEWRTASTSLTVAETGDWDGCDLWVSRHVNDRIYLDLEWNEARKLTYVGMSAGGAHLIYIVGEGPVPLPIIELLTCGGILKVFDCPANDLGILVHNGIRLGGQIRALDEGGLGMRKLLAHRRGIDTGKTKGHIKITNGRILLDRPRDVRELLVDLVAMTAYDVTP